MDKFAFEKANQDQVAPCTVAAKRLALSAFFDETDLLVGAASGGIIGGDSEAGSV